MSADLGEILSAEHKDLYLERYHKADIPISGLCFNNRLAWALGRLYRFRIIEDLACLYCEGEEGTASRHIVLPLGNPSPESLQKVVDHYYPEFQKDGLPLKMMYVPDGYLNLVNEIKGYELEVVHKNDFDEYVYSAESLKKLSGKALQPKRKLYNRFKRECSLCEYSTLAKEDIQDCLQLTLDWCAERGVDPHDARNSDYIAIKTLLDDFDKLDLRGGVVRLMKKVIAFSIGSEPIRDTAFIHFEKTDKTLSGTNVVMASEMVRYEYPDVKFVNREEDMGIEGLRTAKQSFAPISMTRKNDVFLTARS